MHLRILVATITLCAIQFDPWTFGFSQLREQSVDKAELRSRWQAASGLWRARKFSACRESWTAIAADSSRVCGDEHPNTLEARTWIRRCEIALSWNEEQLRLLEQMTAFLLKEEDEKDQKFEFAKVKERITECKSLLSHANQLFGEDSLDSAKWRAMLAKYYAAHGDYLKSRTLLESSAAIYRNRLSDAHHYYFRILLDLIENSLDLGMTKAGIEYVEVAEQCLKKSDRPKHEKGKIDFLLQFKYIENLAVAREYDNVTERLKRLDEEVSKRWAVRSLFYVKYLVAAGDGFLLQASGQESAKAYVDRAVQAFNSLNVTGEGVSEFRAKFAQMRSKIALREGNWKAAARHAQSAISSLEAADHEQQLKVVFFARCWHAEALGELRQREAANRELAAAIELKNEFAKTAPFSLFSVASLLCCQTARKIGALDKSDRLAVEAINAYQSRVGRDYYRLSDIFEELGRIRHAQRRFSESEEYFTRALRIRAATFGEDTKSQLRTLRAYHAMLTDWKQPEKIEQIANRIRRIE